MPQGDHPNPNLRAQARRSSASRRSISPRWSTGWTTSGGSSSQARSPAGQPPPPPAAHPRQPPLDLLAPGHSPCGQSVRGEVHTEPTQRGDFSSSCSNFSLLFPFTLRLYGHEQESGRPFQLSRVSRKTTKNKTNCTTLLDPCSKTLDFLRLYKL